MARPTPEVVLQCVSSEEDGGLGAFAALERDDRSDACLIPEPTGFAVVCAQAGALTSRGTVHGRAAHAALRLEGRSAIHRYVEVHAAIAAHERRINADVAHPAMRPLELPYPLSVGRVSGGEWSSSVPDRLVFEGRLGVRVGEDLAAARAAFEAAAGDDVEIEWAGGAFAPAETDPENRGSGTCWKPSARSAARPRSPAFPWGADMRHYTARGIPACMVGTNGIELAHAVDERVSIDEVASLARIIATSLRLMLPMGARDDIRRRSDAAGLACCPASAASSWRSTRSRPRSQKPGSARSMPTIRPRSSGGIEPPADSSRRYVGLKSGPTSSYRP